MLMNPLEGRKEDVRSRAVVCSLRWIPAVCRVWGPLWLAQSPVVGGILLYLKVNGPGVVAHVGSVSEYFNCLTWDKL